MTFSYGFDNENIKKKRRSHVRSMLSGIILAQWQHPVASSEALDLLHRAMHTVTYRCIAMAIKMASLHMYLLVVVCMPVALAAAGAIINAFAWPSKWPAMEAHSFVIVDFIIDNNRSQRPRYGPLKLKLRHSNIYNNVISLLLSFGLPPTPMDAVLATIVTGGQAQIILNIEVDKNKLITTLIY